MPGVEEERWKFCTALRRLDVHKDTSSPAAPHGDRLVEREVRNLQDDDQGFARPVGLARRARLHPRRNGGDRRLLEAGVAYPQRRRLCLGAGERSDVKNVPGRKTDVNDATWLADLLAHGLIRGSFVPDEQTQEMPNLLRTRKQLVRSAAAISSGCKRTLEDANIKLDSVISDIMASAVGQ